MIEDSSARDNVEISNQQLIEEVNKAKSELQSLEEELRMRMSRQDQASLSAEETSQPSKRPRFFKTPRTVAVYSSPVSPSPRKRLNTSSDRRPSGSFKPVRTLSKSVPSSPRCVQ